MEVDKRVEVRQNVGVIFDLWMPSDRSDVQMKRRTVNDRLDLGHLHDRFDVHGPEVADTERASLERSILDKRLQMLPKVRKGDACLCRNGRFVNEDEIGDECELVEGPLDGRLDVRSGGLGLFYRSA